MQENLFVSHSESSAIQALVVSTALKPNSKTITAARVVRDRLEQQGVTCDLVDLSAESLPQCDGDVCYRDEGVAAMTQRVQRAKLIVMCFPVYNYQANSAAKNFIELTNNGWKNKVVSFVANAGGDRSFLAPLSLANSLMVDHQCLIVPHFLYLSPSSYNEAGEVVLKGLAGDLLEDQIRSACHLSQFALLS